jgi:hypothetical protein
LPHLVEVDVHARLEYHHRHAHLQLAQFNAISEKSALVRALCEAWAPTLPIIVQIGTMCVP